uniref:C2H2-type domain-containing protein n=1 Tax=Leptobrachium leishanense TaxID=445787 RepID=A0A8C5PTF6_9ANUR
MDYLLLAGEDHMVVRRKSAECSVSCMCRDVSEGSCRIRSCSSVSAPRFPLRERHNEEKILELSNQIIRLLTGEVPIRCEDVTVYLSMEEWEYVERHKELYEDLMMEHHQPRCVHKNSCPAGSTPSVTLAKDEVNNETENKDFTNEPAALDLTRTLLSPAAGDCNLTDISPPAERAPTLYPCIPAPCGHVAHTAIYPPRRTQCVYMREKSTGRNLDVDSPAARVHTASPCADIKEESDCGEGIIKPCPSTRQTVHASPRIKEEPAESDGKHRDVTLQSAVMAEHDQSVTFLLPEHNTERIYSCTEGPESHTGPSELIQCQSNHLGGQQRHSGSDHANHELSRTGETLFPCADVGENFNGLYQLVLHPQIHPGEFLVCLECGAQFTERAALIAHHMIHAEAKPFKCNECGKCFARATHLASHKWIHTGEKAFKCSECGKGFTRAESLAIHRRIHTGDKPFKCNECGKCFTQAIQLTSHSWMHTGEKTFKCCECGKGFTRASNLALHMRTHREEKAFKCTDCGKCFTQASSYVSHKRIHTGEKPYKCTECGRGFIRSTNLASHRWSHRKDTPFTCTDCGKSFTRPANLALHRRIHTGEKPYQCSECGRCFAQASTLISHKRTHTGEKPFKCNECGKYFTLKHVLVSHQRIHTGERPYKCNECGKCFVQSTNLSAHRRIHTGEKPHKCDECGKGFTRPSELTSHKRTHTGEKPYICRDCGKGFTQASSLTFHKRVHTGEKPFKCTECGKCFTRATNLSAHRKLHTGQKSA